MEGVATGASPVAAVLGSNLYVAWKGVNDDPAIWWSHTAGGAFSNQLPLPDVQTSSSPAIAAFEGRLYLAWKGRGDDPTLYYASMSP